MQTKTQVIYTVFNVEGKHKPSGFIELPKLTLDVILLLCETNFKNIGNIFYMFSFQAD